VHRRSELDELVGRHGTRQQAAFFLKSRGRSLEEVESRHDAQQSAMTAVAGAIPLDWRRGQVERSDLARFLFGPEDVVVAVGQDGLVANVAKYLSGQVVLGINPEPSRNPGVLVLHPPDAAGRLLDQLTVAAEPGPVALQARVMVEAAVDDGQVLRALNEVYVGHPTHQSARYRIETAGGTVERHSSSGVLVGTGTGATGWCRSTWLERRSPLRLPRPEEPRLCWFAREVWPSPATGTDLTEGLVDAGEGLAILAESDLVIFGDGIEADALSLTWGQRVTLRVSDQHLRLLG
jgi:hypothetical protein